MASLPLLKLGGLLVKTIAKPVASRMKTEAKKHPNFKAMCIYAGQSTYQFTTRITLWAQGNIKILKINPMPEDDALSRGVNFFSEGFVFLVAGSIIVFETNRADIKNAAKALKEAEKDANFLSRIEALEKQLAILTEQAPAADIDDKLYDLDTRMKSVEKVASYWAMKEVSHEEACNRKHRLHVPAALDTVETNHRSISVVQDLSPLGPIGDAAVAALSGEAVPHLDTTRRKKAESQITTESTPVNDKNWYGSWFDLKWLYNGWQQSR